MPPGFNRHELRCRYDVTSFQEDEWHAYSGERTAELVAHHLSRPDALPRWLLNAGSGVYRMGVGLWNEVCVDLFLAPIRGRPVAVCASVERLPFARRSCGAVVCVGEVLAYCDPASAIAEFSRVLAPMGTLICDFRSSRSARYWLHATYRRAADLIVDDYNGTPERTWVYDPEYVSSVLVSCGFEIKARVGTHIWSAMARRAGASRGASLFIERSLGWASLPATWADLTTIVAVRVSSST